MNAANLRPSPIAGAWYEANPKLLAANIDRYLGGAKLPEIRGEVVAVIAPHAGHRYSGQVAAYAFAALRGLAPSLVVVLSPFHDFAPYPLITSVHAAYSTPLGNIEIDSAALEELQANLDIPITRIANDKEHSLEIELPFLQRVLKSEFKLLPVMLRAQEPEVAQKFGGALAKTLHNKNALIVASTDLSHFYDSQTASILDHEMLKRFESFVPESIFEAERARKGFACGHAAVAAMLYAAKQLGADKVQTLHYATSGEVTGDYASVVGYGAAVVLNSKAS
ncbi:MAG: AmmeMemoRadiSam system protein B [Anaerolineales bacterium]|nr:AmmeMemoRadiSam system protein B [Anaerolineales bacterium]